MQPPPEKFGPVAIFLHWLVAVLIIAAAGLGLFFGYTNDVALSRASLNAHQSLGVVVFVLAFVRVAWRVTHPAPPLPPGIPRSQKIAAAVTHFLLYVLLFALPLTGYVALAARGRDIVIFGLFDLPQLVPQGLKLAAAAQNLHDQGEYVLYGLVALHIGAALYHRFIRREGILKRMWP